MSVPAKRKSRTSSRRRRGQFTLKRPNLTPCAHCNKPILLHRACPYCGYWRGRKVLEVKRKKKPGKWAEPEAETS
jgi:large subunit ribosomal protein L32